MKITQKLAVSSALIASLVLSPVAAFADEATQTTTTTSVEVTQDIEVGLTPDSFFYFFKQLIRDINIYFADDEKEKAELLLQYANEKAAELKAMNEAENTEYNEEQLKEIEELLTDASDLIAGEDAEQTDGDATETETDTQTDTDQTTDGDVTTEPTPEPTTETGTDTTTEPQQEEATEEEGTMGPVHALAVLKGLLDKLPEEGRKGVENAIKHLEKNIEKKAKKQKKHQTVEVKTETEASATTTTTTDTTSNTTTGTATTGTTTGTTTTTAPATTTVPTAEQSTEATTQATMPINPDLLEENAKATQQPTTTAPVTKERQDNGLHLGHDKQKDKETKQKENRTPNNEEKKNDKN